MIRSIIKVGDPFMEYGVSLDIQKGKKTIWYFSSLFISRNWVGLVHWVNNVDFGYDYWQRLVISGYELVAQSI